MRFIDPALSAKRSAAGRSGGYATFFKYGREQMQGWGKMGGRPRLLTLEELQSQVGARESLINTKRRNGCQAVAPSYCRVGAIVPNKKEGELAVRVPAGSPEGV